MRLISGKYKGRIVEGFNIIGTRPTMDRIKESFIAMIQNKIKNSVCLDLFAGSGSVGLELLSNGANTCYFVDSNIKAIDILKNNIDKLKIEETFYLIKGDYLKALNDFKTKQLKFDIIFLDPPYDLNLIKPSLNLIKKHDLLSKDGIIVCEYINEDIEVLDYEIVKQKKYGDKLVRILKYKAS